jgi:hypothetical protein
MNVELSPKQQQWCRDHFVKDGIKIFEVYEKSRVIRLTEAERLAVEESQRRTKQ